MPGKREHVVVLGRITPAKGQHIAARLAHKTGLKLILAGPVGPYHDPGHLRSDLACSSADQNPDVRYWRDQVADYVDDDRGRLDRRRVRQDPR